MIANFMYAADDEESLGFIGIVERCCGSDSKAFITKEDTAEIFVAVGQHFISRKDERNSINDINKSINRVGSEQIELNKRFQQLEESAKKEDLLAKFEQHKTDTDRYLNQLNGGLTNVNSRVQAIETQNAVIKTYVTMADFEKLIDENNKKIGEKFTAPDNTPREIYTKEPSSHLKQMIAYNTIFMNY